jgi:hypothetical protein
VAGLSRAAGSWQKDTLKNHVHAIRQSTSANADNRYIFQASNVPAGSSPYGVGVSSALSFDGNHFFADTMVDLVLQTIISNAETAPRHISQPMIVYLGRPA